MPHEDYVAHILAFRCLQSVARNGDSRYQNRMARKSAEMRRLDAREEELTLRIGIKETELRADKLELEEIQVARRVLSRLAGSEDRAEAEPEAAVADNGDTPPDELVDGQNLTIGQMALVLLEQAGEQGLTSNEILELIRQRWLPSLARTSLSPPLSRLKKKEEIILEGEHWKLAAGNEAKPAE